MVVQLKGNMEEDGTDHIFYGCGRFLVGVEGSVFVSMWPIQKQYDLECKQENVLPMLRSLRKPILNKWFQDSIHDVLRPDDVIWIPFGYNVYTIALEDSSYAILPYMNTAMASEHLPSTCLRYIHTTYQDILEALAAGDNDVWMGVASGINDFLESLGVAAPEAESAEDDHVSASLSTVGAG